MRAIFIGFLFSFCTLFTPLQLLADDFRDGVRAYNQKDFSRALSLWLPLAEQDNALAQTLVGSMYAYGEGTERNDVQAVKWFTRAAMHGSAQAQYNLGIMYEQGFGVEKDLDEARRWLMAAAEQGRKEARKRLDALPASPVASAVVEQTQRPTPAPVPGIETEADELLGPPGIDTTAATDASVAWLQQQPAKHYTIQLAASREQRLIDARMKDIQLTGKLAQIMSKRNEQTWHAIVYGSFASYNDAKRALDALPEKLRSGQPWIRSFASIKQFQER